MRQKGSSKFFTAVLFCVCLFSLVLSSFAELIQPRRIVDSHTAGVLPKAYYDFECRVYSAGDPSLGSGLMMGLFAGLTDRLDLGIMYGGEGLIGRGRGARFNPLPGVQVKYRLFEEGFLSPGVALGYDHQGFGGIADTSDFEYQGYIFKSPGFFLAISKNYLLLSRIQLGLHGSMNYSLEGRQEVSWPNICTGFDMGINDELSFVLEYDLAFNDRGHQDKNYARFHKGYLNAGLRWAFTPSFYLELDVKDILENKSIQGRTLGWSRELKIVYYSHF